MDKRVPIAVIGSGMAGLSAAAMLVAEGHTVEVFEQNYLAGGCSSSYYRKGFIFESGATTLVGLDEGMPLHYLISNTGISLDAKRLELPMLVHLADGQTLTRYGDLEAWIAEAERVFGKSGQRPFWEYCYRVSRFVWSSSIRQLSFPPTRLRDIPPLLHSFHPRQLRYAGLAFVSMRRLLKRYGLDKHQLFLDFVDEQLLITAQNKHTEVNVLFGATALCYTLFGNYYLYGGMMQLVRELSDYIQANGGIIHLRHGIHRVRPEQGGYRLFSAQGEIVAQRVVFAIPLNNALKIFEDPATLKRTSRYLLPAGKLNSAFQLGIGFQWGQESKSLHHQIHLPEALMGTGSRSIFLSYSDREDITRAPLGQGVASVSTHIPLASSAKEMSLINKTAVVEHILQLLDERGYVPKEKVLYHHASAADGWERWTKREYGFVGGYPQYFNIKPWQMKDARLDGKNAYICGDSTYPGQGIPGACLSGLAAVRKMQIDGLKKQA